MKTNCLQMSFRFLSGIILVGLFCCCSAVRAQELPEYIELLSPAKTRQPNSSSQHATAGQVASNNVLSLDKAMMPIYASALKKFQKNILSRTPIIIARFTGGGGEMTLYRPGKEPLVAPSPSIVYQYVKSCGHSAMAIYQLTVPYITNPSRGEWRVPMQMYRGKIKTAVGSLDSLEVTDDQREVLRAILQNNLDFMDNSLKNGTFTLEDLDDFAKKFKPLAEKAIWFAADEQVSHWMTVLDQWKKMLGDDWNKVHAATNTMYVTRQNNILFSILVQYMGKESIHRRLILFETTEFVTSEEQMLSLLTRVIADRSLGMVYFGNYYLMDYELLGGGARRAIEEQCQKRGMTPILPTMSPFNSTEWPWRTDPKSGTGPATLEQTGSIDGAIRIRQRRRN
ncbi:MULTISPECIES: hypothetical protein [Gimesia]|uniref:DUF1570 domain-containing protein n=1 Tax=Gimesia algae TaxID=2527971 RepID=A0A517VLD5_9PLAN|nr:MULTISPECIES: hypothetical protein [Gimesia]QDT81713.1 hypothetical protein Mal35_51970 [Gimesia maris]QDT93817.1 hypothetical protein Pan161_55030 [Gimesia algae]